MLKTTSIALFMFLSIGCGGYAEPAPIQQVSAESGVDGGSPLVEPISTVRPQPSADAGTDSPDAWFCQPCCLNFQQWNCIGGNASMTKECKDPGAPAICVPNDCVGLQCGF